MAAADSTNLGLAEDIDVPYAGGAVGTEDCVFHNVANCPDCSGGMIRQGGCCFCPECGFESCGA
ncbi:MAG TPA: hypothetical protein VMY05_09555 [Acidobacteriota bacterium]|nr:hypothetical protein [Acidobacteriota bacterium]